MACLRSFSRRSLSPVWLCSQAPKPLLLLRIEDETEPKSSSSSLLVRRYHRQVLSEERSRMSSFVRPVVSGALLCKHMSSSSSSKPEDSFTKVDSLGSVSPEETLEAIAANVSIPEECAVAIENFSFPGNFVHYVINGIHELTGFNWWMSIVVTAFLVNGLMSPISMRYHKQAWKLLWSARGIQKVRRVIKTGDPRFLRTYKRWEADMEKEFEGASKSFINYFSLDAIVYLSFIKGIEEMAKKIPEFGNGGILWFTDLSTPDKFYILPLLAGFTFWFPYIIHGNWSNLSSRMKELPGFLVVFIALQATFQYESAVYFYVIPSRLYMSTLVLMLSTKQMVKLRSILGWADMPVKKAPEQQQRIMVRVFRLMREFTDVLKKKAK